MCSEFLSENIRGVHHLVQLLSVSEKFCLRRDCGFSRLRMGYIGGRLRKALPCTVVSLVCMCFNVCDYVWECFLSLNGR
jgi:hypothetical protein